MASRIGDLLVNNTTVRHYIYEGTCYGWFHKYQPQIICSLFVLIFMFFIGAMGIIYLQNGNLYARDCWPNICETIEDESSVSTVPYEYVDYNVDDPINYYNDPPAPESWTFRFPSPTNRNLLSIAYGDAGFVAIGEDNTILLSKDGRTWETQPLFLSYDITFESIVFGAGVYWLKGNNGLSWISDNAIEWSPSEYSFSRGIASGNGVYVGIDNNNLYFHYMNNDWSPLYEPWDKITIDGMVFLSSVVFGNGTFSLLGVVESTEVRGESNDPNEGFQCIWTSTDGIRWELTAIFQVVNTNLVAQFESIELIFVPGSIEKIDNYFGVYDYNYYEGIYLLFLGELHVSKDGEIWKRIDTLWNSLFTPTGTSCIYNGFCISIVGNTKLSQTMMAYTLDFGFHWEYLYLNQVYNQIDQNNGIFVLVGDGGAIFNLNATFNDYYDIEANWAPSGAATSLDLDKVIFGQSTFVSIGFDSINQTYYSVHSIDGLNWRATKLELPMTSDNIVFGNRVYLMAIEDVNSILIYASSDALQWHELTFIEGEYSITDFIFSAGQYLLLVKDKDSLTSVVFTSDDGIDWESRNTYFEDFPRTVFISQIIWNPVIDQYFAISASGYIWTSKDLSNWRLVYSSGICYSIAVNSNDGFVFAVCSPAAESDFAVIGGKYGGVWYTFYTFSSDFTGSIKYYHHDNSFYVLCDRVIKSDDNFKSVRTYKYPIEISEISSFAIGNGVVALISKSAVISSKISAL